jgi:predicted acylesterase/phospholipase RssA
MRGIVFSGGGALGAWHVGVLKHKLLNENIKYDAYAGVSAGALVASYISQFKDSERFEAVEKLEETMISIRKEDVYQNWHPFGYFQSPFKSSLVNSIPLQEFIKFHINPIKIHNSKKILRIGATSLRTGEFEIFTEKTNYLPEAIAASTSVPGFFTPVNIPEHEGLWVDGGIRTMTPIAALIEAGCDEIDVSICFPKTSTKYYQTNINLFNVLFRSTMIMKDQILWNDFRKAELYNELVLSGKHPEKKYVKLTSYSPDRDLNYRILDFNGVLMQTYSDKGYYKTKEIFDNKQRN